VGAEAPRAAEPTAPADRNVAVGSHGHRCLKVVSESGVAWAIYVPILVFLGLSVLDLGPMYATDRRQTDRQTDRQTLQSIIA